MATSSVNTTVQWGSVSATEIRSVQVSGDDKALVDATELGNSFKTQLAGQIGNPTITVVTLDKPDWGISDVSADLSISYGGTTSVNYYNCQLTEVSPSVGIDAAVEITWTFTSMANDSSGTAGGYAP